MIINIKDLYNIHAIENNCVLTKNQDIVLFYRLLVPEVYSPSPDDYEVMQSELYKFAKNLPNHSILHLQNHYKEEQFKKEALPGASFLQKAEQKHFEGRTYISHGSYAYVILPKTESLQKNNSLSIFGRAGKVIEQDIIRMMELYKEIDKIVSTLNTSQKLHLEPLNEDEIRKLIRVYLTGLQGDKLTDINFEPFQIGNNFYRCYALSTQDNLPDKIYSCKKDIKVSTDRYTYYKGFTHSLGLELKCNHITNQYIYKEDHQKIKKKIEKTAEEFNTVGGFGTKNKKGAEVLTEYLTALENDENIRLCRTHYDIFTFASSTNELDKIEKETLNAFKELDIMPYQPIYLDQVRYFLASVPGNASFMPVAETFVSDIQQALVFTHLVTNYYNDKTGIRLNDRLYNTPIIKDVWYKPYSTKQIRARNFLAICETGGGKSFLTTHMYRTYIEQDYSLILCDIGSSNEGLAMLYPDKVQYIRYKEGEPFGINPFLLSTGEELTANKIQSLSNFVFIHWYKDKVVPDVVRVSMNNILIDYFKKDIEHKSLPQFYKYIQNDAQILERLEIKKEYFDRDEFLHVCKEYIDGMYDFLYKDSGTCENINKKCVFFELEEALENPSILPIMFLMISDTIDNKIWKNNDGPKVLVYEEAAKFINFPSVLTAIEYTAQTVRKYEGGMGLVIQTIDNIPDTKLGKAILTNMHTYWIFRPDKGKESLKSRLELSEHEMYQIMSCTSDVKGAKPYTEVALLLGTELNVVRLEVPREVYWTYVSDKDLKKPLFEIYKETGDFELAIKKMVKHENRN